VIISEGATLAEATARRRWSRVVAAGVLAVTAGSLIAGCAGSPGQQQGAPARPSPPTLAGPGGTPGDPDVALCRGYLAASGDAHAPLSAMRTEAVLMPTVDFIELGANQMATRAAGARSPMIAAAMRQVVAAQEDLDAQGRTKLPAGTGLNATTVRLNPDRLATALDGADRACTAP
jgi:hypothetical protein